HPVAQAAIISLLGIIQSKLSVGGQSLLELVEGMARTADGGLDLVRDQVVQAYLRLGRPEDASRVLDPIVNQAHRASLEARICVVKIQRGDNVLSSLLRADRRSRQTAHAIASALSSAGHLDQALDAIVELLVSLHSAI